MFILLLMRQINNDHSKIRYFKDFWTREIVETNPNWLFIYGDNNIKKGLGGQAIIRGLPNTLGVPTKKYPSNAINSFYTDFEYIDNIKRIRKAINKIIKNEYKYEYIIFPENGLGTGLADLPTKAPKTYAYLTKAIEKIKKIL